MALTPRTEWGPGTNIDPWQTDYRLRSTRVGKPRHFACQAPPPRRVGGPSHVGTSWQGWSSRGVELGRGMPIVGTHWSGSRKRRLFAKKSRKNPDCVCTPSRAPNPNECFLRSSRLLVRGDGGDVAGAVLPASFSRARRPRDVQSLPLLTHTPDEPPTHDTTHTQHTHTQCFACKSIPDPDTTI